MVKKTRKSNIRSGQMQCVEVSNKQIEILARRLLPEIKRFFADDDIRREFEQWQKKRQSKEIY